jgi:hypothetical protein
LRRCFINSPADFTELSEYEEVDDHGKDFIDG